jgi:uncharacterized protein YhfF
MQLGYPRTQLRQKLVEAVLNREKTATSSLRAEYELDGRGCPRSAIGFYSTITMMTRSR